MKKGKVYIIGAGPGDPGLITLKAHKALLEAEVIVYDHLVNEEILPWRRQESSAGIAREYMREGREEANPVKLIYAGKQGGDHTLSQEEINKRLVSEALAGKIVARLKGGDPFIFGRGGEEAEELARQGIAFEVIPGVTSAIAVPAYAGIPLTHRDYTSTVAFVTGHEDPTKGQSSIDWQALAGIGTLVFLMGVKNLPHIVSSLTAAGKNLDTPAALIANGTTSDQKTIIGNLGNIVALAQGLRPPAILVVGEVVGLRERLRWFEAGPLFNRGVMITRPQGQAAGLAALLRNRGARVIHFPTIEIIPPETYENLDSAINRLDDYAWIIFTSANGVRFFFARLRELGGDLRDLKGIRIATIGPATAKSLEALGIRVDLVPDSFISEGVVAAFARIDIRGKKILLPRAAQARDVIPEELGKLGARVEPVAVYRTITTKRKREEISALLQGGLLEVITFTSPSTVMGFREIWGSAPLPPEVKIACLGPVTGEAAKKAGFEVDIMENVFTIERLVAGISSYFEKQRLFCEPTMKNGDGR